MPPPPHVMGKTYLCPHNIPGPLFCGCILQVGWGGVGWGGWVIKGGVEWGGWVMKGWGGVGGS